MMVYIIADDCWIGRKVPEEWGGDKYVATVSRVGRMDWRSQCISSACPGVETHHTHNQ